jgi:hypothetical protein
LKKIIAALFLTAGVLSPLGVRAAEDGTASGKIKQGLENVKEGTQDAAKGVQQAAEKVGQKVATAGKKVGHTFKAATCPVVGDRRSKLYYAADSKSYDAALSGQKFSEDERECFMTEKSARDEGYTRTAN